MKPHFFAEHITNLYLAKLIICFEMEDSVVFAGLSEDLLLDSLSNFDEDAALSATPEQSRAMLKVF